MPEVLVISGSGPYSDPWHRFPETSGRLATIIGSLGCSVEVTEDVEGRLAQPGRCDLLVVNIGNPSEARPAERIAAAAQGLSGYLAGGGALLGVHVSATSLTTMPEWPTMLGGGWVRGRTMHPPLDLASIAIRSDAHPIVRGLVDFEILDERYSYLQTHPGIEVLCDHEYDGRRHPVVWARETDQARVVYDGLGHDTRSYDSAAHVELLERSVHWLLREL
jgi:type 1 glutamine amidotransferase